MNTQNYTQKTVEAIQNAQNIARENDNQSLVPEHLLYSLLDQDGGLIPSLFKKMGVDCNTVLGELDSYISTLPKVSGGEMYLSSETDRVIRTAEKTLTLTRKETGILEYLMVHQGRPVSQEELMDHVWDNSVDSFSNSIRVHISALRKKLRAVLGYDPIRNRIGEGYLMGGEEV